MSSSKGKSLIFILLQIGVCVFILQLKRAYCPSNEMRKSETCLLPFKKKKRKKEKKKKKKKENSVVFTPKQDLYWLHY